MDIIHLLSDSVANQIAAGEVVQRPASVVKELMENAIDAGSTEIKLIIKDSGRTLIQVIDNGKGMSVTDCRMSFERHATSKISKSEDLFKITTMGFRGEALASIAAVAQVEVKTRRAEDELGTSLQIEGSEYKSQEPIASPIGTNIQVKNLFYNVPARRKFLKSNPVEMKNILDEFQRVALSYPEVAFEVFHNDTEIYKLPQSNLAKRISDIFGKNYRTQLGACEEITPYVSIKGFVGKPESAKKTRGDQFFFINRRFVKNAYLHHAVVAAFEGTIAEGYHPFYVLQIEIDPSNVDINIHPQKTEIKFDDEKAVYSILRSAVRQALGVYHITPSIDFESDINFGNIAFNKPTKSSSSSFERPDLLINNFEKTVPRPNYSPEVKPQGDWRKLYEGLEKKTPEAETNPQTETLTFSSKANPGREIFENEEPDSLQIHNELLAVQVKSGMMLIDLRAAWERIFYEQYFKNLENKAGASQQLLFQKTLQLRPDAYGIALEIREELHALGFGFEEFGSHSLLLSGIPVGMSDEEGLAAMEHLIADYSENESKVKLQKSENLAKALAKRNAGRQLKKMDKSEAHSLINRLFATSMPGFTPDGEKTMEIITLEQLFSLVKSSKTKNYV